MSSLGTPRPELIARAALTTVAICSCIGSPLGTMGAVGVNIIANLIQSNWNTYCGVLWKQPTLLPNPIDSALRQAISTAVDQARDAYRETPTVAERARQLITREEDPTDRRFAMFKTALLADMGPGQITSWIPGMLGWSQDAIKGVLETAIEDFFSHQTADATEIAIRDTVKVYLQDHLSALVEQAFQAQLYSPASQGQVLFQALQTLEYGLQRAMLHDLITAFNEEQLGAARIVQVKELAWGQQNAGIDILIADPVRDMSLEQQLPYLDAAEKKLKELGNIAIVGRGLSGKSYLAGLLLESLPDRTFVVMPERDTPPARLDFLAGHEAVLFIDDFHENARTLRPAVWLRVLQEHATKTYVILTSRSDTKWREVRENAASFLNRLRGDYRFDIPELTYDQGRIVAENMQLGRDWDRYFDGTIGSLRCDLTQRADDYRALSQTQVRGIDATTIIDSAKVLYWLHQPSLPRRLVRGVANIILGMPFISNPQWQALEIRTAEAEFGRFDDAGHFRIHESYLDDEGEIEVVAYDPTDDLRAAANLIMQEGDGIANFYLGVAALIQLDDLALAKLAYQRGAELGVGLAASNHGALLAMEGRLEDAKALFREGIALGSGYAAIQLGITLTDEGKIEKAKAAFRQGIELREGGAACLLGDLLDMEGKEEEAKSLFQEGIALGYGHAAVHLGRLLVWMGEPGEAKTAYQQGIDLGDGSAALALGELLEEDGNRAGARVAFLQGIDLARENDDLKTEAESFNRIGLLDYDEGNLATALHFFTEAAQVYRDDSDLDEAIPLSNQGLAFLGLGDEPAATRAYSTALVMFYRTTNSIGIMWCLQGLSAAAFVRKDIVLAAQLGGVTHRLSHSLIDEVSYSQQRRAEAFLAPVHDQRGDITFDNAWAEGESMSCDTAISLIVGSISQ